jgi:hypothetical protein
VALWVVPMLVIGVLVVLHPLRETVTMGSYHPSAAHWWTRQNLYVGPGGMNYLPVFAVLFTPFHLLPLWLGEALWRFCNAATLLVGLWQMTRSLFGTRSDQAFLWATILTMPLCMTALRFGNANAILGGVTLMAAAAILNRRWWLACGLMALATAIKPLGIVLMLLAPLFYGPLRWRVPLALLGLAIFPFLFGPPAYVWGQHRAAWTNLQACAVVREHRFADINGLLRTVGTEFKPGVSQVARVVAGGLTSLLWLWGAKRLREPLACLWLYALATGYLMLFNPMTEENSYGILAPALGVWATLFLLQPELRAARALGWTIAAMSLSMGLLPNLLHPIFGNYFALFWHPLMTIVFLALLARFIGRRSRMPASPTLTTPG